MSRGRECQEQIEGEINSLNSITYAALFEKCTEAKFDISSPFYPCIIPYLQGVSWVYTMFFPGFIRAINPSDAFSAFPVKIFSPLTPED
jgi:hypothetical protein